MTLVGGDAGAMDGRTAGADGQAGRSDIFVASCT